MPRTLGGGPYAREKIKLDAGGQYACDAVSADHQTAAIIATSRSTTSGNKHAVGKATKVRSDILFLVMSLARRKVLVLTDQSMHEWCRKEQDAGRLPRFIEIHHAQLPPALADKLVEAQELASQEMRAAPAES
jgi:hypothetical protein